MGVTTEPDSTDGAARSVEIEVKFDVAADTPLPDWSALPGVASMGEPERRDLDALYFDTAGLTLSHAGYAVRRRTGGPDEGWHIKGPRVGDGRIELHWPLGQSDDIPEGVRAALASVMDALGASAEGALDPESSALTPIARIQNTRTAYALRDQDGGLVAEFVDDRVVANDERAGVERRWREWELELGPAAPLAPEDRTAFFATADDAVRAAGGRIAASDSKLARALGV
ncbi:CYTH domain-containing protein [Microbacterium allomyrinae]|uniref:CYTH domain-containing protein n=1 Tax=Microbacterium allomyrinae TaxID=2830666 RepID=A0A9X1S3E6_9MICO|nr:CYTH domain-containing protein [Microbacterium allomyrinae]